MDGLTAVTALLAALAAQSPPGVVRPAISSVPVPAAAGAMAPNLFSGRKGVLLTWLEPGAAGTHRLRIARLGGEAWSDPVTIFDSPRIVANWADVPSVVESDNGRLVAYWPEQNGPEPHSYDAVLGQSDDGGRTWVRSGPVHHDGTLTEHGFVSLLADRSEILVAWLDGRQKAGLQHHQPNGATTLRVAQLPAGPVPSRLPSRVVDSRVCDCCGTAAAMTGRGPVIVYRDRGAGEIRDIFAVRRTAGQWQREQPVHRDAWKVPGCPVNGPAVAAHEGHLAVAWYTYASSEPKVRVAFSGDAGEHFAGPIDVDVARGSRAPVGRLEMTLLNGQEAAVSWMTAEREQGTLFVRRVAADGRMGAPLRVALVRSDREGGFPRMERLDTDLIFAWTAGEGSQPIRTARVSISALPALVQGKNAEAAPPVAQNVPAAIAPDVSVVNLEGRPVSLKQLRGRVVLVNFWATWCEPCRMELPELAALQERFGHGGLEVVGINLDREVSAERIRAFAARRKATFRQWLDRREALTSAMGVSLLPTTFLLDRDGRVVWRASGAITAADPALRAQVERTLSSAAAGGQRPNGTGPNR